MFGIPYGLKMHGLQKQIFIMKKNYYKLIIVLPLFIFFLLDRITKYLATNKLPSSGVYLFKYINLKLETNLGIAFGIKMHPIIIIISVSLIILILVYIFLKNLKKENYLNSFLIGLILIGAFSNLFDRIIKKGVIDFIEIGIWPSFNLADLYISLAVLLYILLNLKNKTPNQNG